MPNLISLIVGLGNPGIEYKNTNHNAGFWLIDQLANVFGIMFHFKKSFLGNISEIRIDNRLVFFLKPETYMNQSGQSIQAVLNFYKLLPENMLILHDEIDLIPGQVKLKQGGRHNGHNGLKNIQACLNSTNFWRIRIGIGHPRTLNILQPVKNFVLCKPGLHEKTCIKHAMDCCQKIIPFILKGDFTYAMQQLNCKKEVNV